ncbi:hypothetical protein XU06_22765 [Rhodococcus erythropolis]|uniref:hypothetical protein n=1 Tax=Rhodococcus erythropolis TaxID=1833 RepID=UPI00061B639E|nr:hypothetical protein [Rhodococcus erythropolis]AKD99185.1 hypothetical protein XU06_22765 [Rhodococcus erythropolis]
MNLQTARENIGKTVNYTDPGYPLRREVGQIDRVIESRKQVLVYYPKEGQKHLTDPSNIELLGEGR